MHLDNECAGVGADFAGRREMLPRLAYGGTPCSSPWRRCDLCGPEAINAPLPHLGQLALRIAHGRRHQ